MASRGNNRKDVSNQRHVLITGCGTSSGRRATLEVELAAEAGTFSRLGCLCLLDRNEKDVRERQAAIQSAMARVYQSNGEKQPLGQNFDTFIDWLPGVGPDFGHSVSLALKQMPRYHAKVAEIAERTTNHISNLGGAEMAFIHLSSGGHMIPGLALNYSLNAPLVLPYWRQY